MRLRPGDMIEFEYNRKITENQKKTATLYDIDEDHVWFPNSAIENDDGGCIVVPVKLALEKELLDETTLEGLREEFAEG